MHYKSFTNIHVSQADDLGGCPAMQVLLCCEHEPMQNWETGEFFLQYLESVEKPSTEFFSPSRQSASERFRRAIFGFTCSTSTSYPDLVVCVPFIKFPCSFYAPLIPIPRKESGITKQPI